MSTTTVLLLIAAIAGYVAFLAFVLALLTMARRADEAAEELAPHRSTCVCALCAAPRPWAAPGGRSPGSVRGRAEGAGRRALG